MSPLLGSIGGISEYVYRGTLDDWPNPFAFGSVINVEPGSTVGISTIITGINYKASVSASAGSFVSARQIIGITSIYSGDSATSSNTVTVSIASSTSELSVGKRIRILNVSDPRYNGEFTINSLIDSPFVTRFTYQVTNIPSNPRPSISNAQFNYEVYPFTENQLIYIRNNQILEVRISTTSGTDSDFGKQYRTTVKIGRRSADWNVKTREKDNTPNSFIFNDVTGVNITTPVTSNTITISGLEPGYSSYAFISSGIGSFSINGGVGVFNGNVQNGDTISIKEISSDYYSTTKTSFITVGTYTTPFNVITRSSNKLPTQFFFNSLTNVPINQDQVSISTSLTGADNNIPLDASVSFPGQLQVNSDQYISGITQVFNGDSVRLKIPSTAIVEYGTTYSTELNVSGISSSFFVTTRPRPIKTFPNQFTFEDLPAASPSTFIESNVITLEGMTVGVGDTGLATISGADAEFKVIRNNEVIREYSSSPYAVKNEDKIQVKILSSGEGSTTDTKLTVTGIDTFDNIQGIFGFTADTWNVYSRNLQCKINETSFRQALVDVEGSKIKEVKNTRFTVSGLDNGCDTVITTSNPDSYIINQRGVQVANNQFLSITNGDIITIYMKAADTYDTEKSTTIQVRRRNGDDLVSGTWKIKTQLEDKLPNAFDLPTRNEVNVSPCTFRSTYVTQSLSGLSEETVVPATVTSTNNTAQISKNGGIFGSSIVGGVKNGDRIDIRMKSNCDYGGSCEIATVVVGERSDVWQLCSEDLPFPTVTLKANSTSIAYNGSVTLTWTSTFASSVTSTSGTGFTGIDSTQGSITINNLKANTTYSIRVSNAKGSASSSVNVSVAPEPSPTISLSSSPSSISNCKVNGERDLAFFIGPAGDRTGVILGLDAVDRARNCGFTDCEIVGLAIIQGKLFASAAQSSLNCSNSSASSCRPGGRTCPSYSSTSNSSSTLTWSSTNASAVVSSSGSGFTNITQLNGSITVKPTATTTYSITVKNASDVRATASTTVSVSDAPPPTTKPTVTLTSPNATGNTISLSPGGSITLNWTSTDATSVSTYTGFGFIPTSTSGSLVVNNINENTSYTITVRGPGGTTTSNTIFVALNAPVVILSASPTRVPYNGSTTLTWRSTNATSVQSSNFGASSVSGSLVVSNLASDVSTTRDFNITVFGPGGAATSKVTVTLLPPSPTITLSASPTRVPYNGSTTLTWRSTNATSVQSSNFGAADTSGSTTISNLTSNKTYSITVEGPGGTSTDTETITVNSPQPTVNLCAERVDSAYGPVGSECGSSRSVGYKEPFNLKWTSTDATSVQSSNFGASGTSGSIRIENITRSTTYSITVSGPGGTSTDSITVNPDSCQPTRSADSLAQYKTYIANFNNGNQISESGWIKTTTGATLPDRSNYTYKLIHSFIYNSLIELTGRPPNPLDIKTITDLFNKHQNKPTPSGQILFTLDDLYSFIKKEYYFRITDTFVRGGIKSVVDSCGNNWFTSNPAPESTAISNFSYKWTRDDKNAYLEVTGGGGLGYCIIVIAVRTDDSVNIAGTSYSKITLSRGGNELYTWQFPRDNPITERYSFRATAGTYRFRVFDSPKDVTLANDKDYGGTHVKLRDRDGDDANARIWVFNLVQTI